MNEEESAAASTCDTDDTAGGVAVPVLADAGQRVVGGGGNGVTTPGPPGLWLTGAAGAGGLAAGEAENLSAGAAARVSDGLSANTGRAYERNWTAFARWCGRTGRTALPASAVTLAEYVHHLTTVTTQYGGPPAPATIEQALATIQSAHQMTGRQAEVRLARLALRAYRRERAEAGQAVRQSVPITAIELRSLVDALLDAVGAGRLSPLAGQRDQVALVLGFALAVRASEASRLRIADLTFSARGLTVAIRSSKTDQDAAGALVRVKHGRHLETCPVRLAQAWLDTLAAHGITEGPLLRGIDRHGRLGGTPGYAGRGTGRISGQALTTLVRNAVARAEAAGLDVDAPDAYSWHSLRAGFATAASEAGAPPTAIADHGRWRGLLMVMRYWRAGSAWRRNALDGVGL